MTDWSEAASTAAEDESQIDSSILSKKLEVLGVPRALGRFKRDLVQSINRTAYYPCKR